MPVDFRQLVSWVRLGDQFTHQIYPYPAKLLPHIANFFVHASMASRRVRSVLDPFCGSGTVALEASLAGATPYVADANPLALLITKVKTTAYDCELLTEQLRDILGKCRRLRTAPAIPIVNSHLWYSPDRKKAIEVVARAVAEFAEESSRDFFRLCFAITARRLSTADPAISVPVRLRAKPRLKAAARMRINQRLRWIERTDPIEEFSRICSANIERIDRSNSVRRDRLAAVEVGDDARRLHSPVRHQATPKRMAPNTVPLIITSPPYGSAQKYVRASSLSLNWLGLAAPEQLSALEGKSIGREHVPAHREKEVREPLPRSYELMVRRVEKVNPVRAKIVRHYLADMREALKEASRVTAYGGRMVIVMGNNQVCGNALRNDRYVQTICGQNGLTLELGLLDDIKSRGLMTKRNRTASLITQERVLVFKKNRE